MNALKSLLLFLSIVSPITAGANEALPPTYADVSYGDDALNVLDFWKADEQGPRPLLVYIHGGGWTQGDKSRKAPNPKVFLDKGISVAAINYRLNDGKSTTLPAPVHDAARAIQFLRTKADEWNIDASRFALTGVSAGGCTSMWLLCHDDLADPDAQDSVLRESTRVSGAAVRVAQTSIDPKQLVEWLGPNVANHRMLRMAVGEKTVESMFENYETHKAVFEEFSPYAHVSRDDPPLYMGYGSDLTVPCKGAGHGIHHGVQGIKMKEKADEVGMECHLDINKVSKSEKYKNANEFLFSILLD